MKKILIVEDQSDIRRLIRWALEDERFELFEASEGSAGLSAAGLVKPDLILLDVMMPGELDGYQVCTQVKANPDLASIKVVLLSARAQATDLKAGEDAGCDAYLIKPFKPSQLVETVKRLLSTA